MAALLRYVKSSVMNTGPAGKFLLSISTAACLSLVFMLMLVYVHTRMGSLSSNCTVQNHSDQQRLLVPSSRSTFE